MAEEQGQAEQKPVVAFVLSLLAGLWMLVPGAMMYYWGLSMMGGWMRGGRMRGGWMWHHGMMRDIAPAFWWPWFSIIAGVMVLIGAISLYRKPGQRRGWGIAILVLSALNVFLGLGGFLASVLGIIGGALALSWQPSSSPPHRRQVLLEHVAPTPGDDLNRQARCLRGPGEAQASDA